MSAARSTFLFYIPDDAEPACPVRGYPKRGQIPWIIRKPGRGQNPFRIASESSRRVLQRVPRVVTGLTGRVPNLLARQVTEPCRWFARSAGPLTNNGFSAQIAAPVSTCKWPATGLPELPCAPTMRWHETSWGRIFIGLMLAQGLFHGFRRLATGIFLAFNNDGGAEQTVNTPAGFISLQVLQILAVLLGGVMAGSGQRHGVVLGAVVGIWNGVLCAVLAVGLGCTA